MNTEYSTCRFSQKGESFSLATVPLNAKVQIKGNTLPIEGLNSVNFGIRINGYKEYNEILNKGTSFENTDAEKPYVDVEVPDETIANLLDENEIVYEETNTFEVIAYADSEPKLEPVCICFEVKY